MDTYSASILSPGDFLRRVLSFALLGLGAGFLLWAVETVDRVFVLRAGFGGPLEVVELALLLAATVLGAGVFGLLLGLAASVFEVVRQLVAAGGDRLRPGRSRFLVEALSLVVAAILVALALKFFSGMYPQGLELSVERLVRKFDDRLTKIPFVLEHWRGLYTTAIFLVALLVMWAQVWIFRERAGRARLWAGLVAAGALALLGVCYQFDSRAFFARYESTIHYPLVTGYVLMTILLVGFAARALTEMRWTRWRSRTPAVLALALLALGLLSVGYGYVAMDANQNVKAMLWNRSVVARRVFELGRWAIDRDRDGYSPAFGGGDSDDSNASVHPFAAEVAGNGVDDNGTGGDLSPDAAEAIRPPRALPGEFVPAGDAYAWDPKYVPPAADVASAEAAPRIDRGGMGIVAPPAARNVIILSIDCLRADHMSLYGAARPTTPNIDRYAETGLVFENNIPHGTNTGHSFAAMLRSSYMEGIFDRNVPTLTQLTKAAGYHTAFINARRLDDWLTPKRWHRYRPTMIDDFDVLHLAGEREWTAAQLTDTTIDYFDRLDQSVPQFTWVHYMDVHMPREGHPEYGYGPGEIDVYDAEIKYTDEQVGRLLDYWKSTGVLDRSIVFIIADHGEGFLEHGTKDHSNKPYADNSHVPLVVLAPGVVPERVSALTGHIDIAPTALAWARMPVPSVYRGVDLIAAASLPEFPKRVIVSETPRNGIETSFFAWAYVEWPYKYVYDIKGGTSELYDLATDPDEQVNLVERDAPRAASMRRALGEWLDRETAAPAQQARASR